MRRLSIGRRSHESAGERVQAPIARALGLTLAHFVWEGAAIAESADGPWRNACGAFGVVPAPRPVILLPIGLLSGLSAQQVEIPVDSTGQTIDFLLTAKRDAAAAKRFFRKALKSAGNPVPRCKYLNNVVEQDHRTVKKRTWLAKGYGSFSTAWRTLQGIEAVNTIRKGD